jgi:hypothetical protein
MSIGKRKRKLAPFARQLSLTSSAFTRTKPT